MINVKAKIMDNSQQAVKTISEAAKVDPAGSINALKAVGTTATAAGATGVRISVLDALTGIERSNPSLAPQAMAARQALAMEATPPPN